MTARTLFSRRDFLKTSALAAGLYLPLRQTRGAAAVQSAHTIARGPFQPTWESLTQNNRVPEWFRDTKFGMWAHWSAHCVPEQGDWYARRMYSQSDSAHDYHVKTCRYRDRNGRVSV